MTGKIDCFFDCVSPYARFAFVYLRKWRETLQSHGVEVEFHPFFLGGIMGGSGNKPPWTLEVRAKYLKYDRVRAQKHFGLPNMKPPTTFPPVTLLPQRGLVYIKETYPREQFEATMNELWIGLWEQDMDVSQPEVLGEILLRLFPKEGVEAILKAANQKEYKDKLSANTKQALEYGAYGSPWFWVRNHEGKEEPFFGSDRFQYMWEFLGLPWNDIAIQKAQL